jgi:hypothetical protein
MDFIVISGANDSYINTSIDFINAFPFEENKLIFYNLGFNEKNLKLIKNLQSKFNFELKELNFNNYPEHVNLKIYNGLNCSYAFKPIIIYNEANEKKNENKIIIWMDSANRFSKENVNEIITIVSFEGFYSPISAEKKSIEAIELNHFKTLNYFNISQQEHYNELESISANLVAFNYSSETGNFILNKWYEASLKEEVIMPKGSSRNNHRQDQTVLSILIYLFQKKNNINFCKKNVGVEFWNKKDNSTINTGYFPFKLMNKNGTQMAIIYCKTLENAQKEYAERKQLSMEEFFKDFYVI